MNTLVTGGAGFIGSHLVDRLLADGHKVLAIDNLSSGREENLSKHKKNSNLIFKKIDLAENPATFEKLFKNTDWVFHLAARADIVPSIVDPLTYHRSNVDGTVNVLEASRKANVKRFIYAASSSCYGLTRELPTSENTVIDPEYPYALTKYIGEQYVLHYGRVYKMPVISLRLFNVYGSRSRTSGTYGAVFGTFLAQKLAGEPFTVVGDGTQTRDFTFVSDIIDAFILAAQSTISGEIFNVGTGKPQSINRLVKLLKGPVVHIPKRPGEPDSTCANISKIKKTLGWRQKVSFEEGVAILLKNINYWKSAPVWTPQKIKIATEEWFRYLG